MAIKRKTRSGTTIRLICWVLSTIGLGWQMHQISEVYFKYQTQVDMEIEAPSLITMPGLTMCLKIETTTDYTYLQTIYPPARGIIDWARRVNHNASIYRYIPINVLAQLPTQPVRIICKTPFPELKPLKQNQSTQSDIPEMCEDYTTVKTTIQFNGGSDDFWRCSTYFYSLTLPSPYILNSVDDKDFYKIFIHTNRAESIFNFNRSSVLIYIHNPMEVLHLSEADSFHFFIEQTDRMILTTSKLITYLLPTPYRTGCYNYSGEIYGRTGCIFKCRVSRIKKECQSAWSWSVPAEIDQTESFSLRDKHCYLKNKFECSNNDLCPAQCINYWYTTTLIVNQEKRTFSNVTELYVRRPFGVEIIYTYLPRMNGIEFLCYIASCFGIWLGISFLDIIYIISEFADTWMTRRETKILVLNPFDHKNPGKSKISLGSLRTA